jgi:hypothetical protein
VELQQNLDAIRKPGLGVAAISYDSVRALKSFADRQHIKDRLRSDPDSKIIRAFDILNETTKTGTLTYGIPYPGAYIVDAQGEVVFKYFEDDYKDRVSTADILARQFRAAVSAAQNVSDTKHLKLTTAASNDLARPGLRIALSLEIELKPGMHVYAPGVQGYIPIDWQLEGWAGLRRNDMLSNIRSRRCCGRKRSARLFPFIAGTSSGRSTFAQEAALKPLVTPFRRAGRQGILLVSGMRRSEVLCAARCRSSGTSSTKVWIGSALRRSSSASRTEGRD